MTSMAIEMPYINLSAMAVLSISTKSTFLIESGRSPLDNVMILSLSGAYFDHSFVAIDFVLIEPCDNSKRSM